MEKQEKNEFRKKAYGSIREPDFENAIFFAIIKTERAMQGFSDICKFGSLTVTEANSI